MNDTETKIRVLILGDARQVHIHRWSGFLAANGFEPITVSLESVDGVAGACQRIRVPRLLPDLIRYPLAVPAVLSIIRRFDPHIVNAHFVPNYGVIAAMCGFAPWVLSAWGSDIMMLPDKSVFHLERTRHVIRRASYITSDAEVMSQRIIELGAHPDRVITFPFGVDRTKFFPATENTATDRLRVLSNRKLEPVYNIDTLIRAFAEVAGAIPDAHLTIAGSGSRRQALEAEARAGGGVFANSMDFPGETHHNNVPAQLRDHTVFVSIALSDTTSVSLLEAMACGLFPIVSDIPANREWIEHGSNGFIVPPHDTTAVAGAIINAWRDPQLRADAAKKNADLIEARADWFQNMAIVKDLFNHIAKR